LSISSTRALPKPQRSSSSWATASVRRDAVSRRLDLVFVDGSHARSYVESDSRKALRMVRPGGIVFWHDYSGPRRTPGVFASLNALAREMPLVHIGGTTSSPTAARSRSGGPPSRIFGSR
jgi:hypothetical protein